MNQVVASDRPIRWGILGTANIATKVAAAIQAVPDGELVAIASRDGRKARAWAAKHLVPRAHQGYLDLVRDPEIDAVYIPLPPSEHAQWTIRAAEHGKHVLCEKPLALDFAEGQKMAAACKHHQVQLMDGVMWVHHDRTGAMQLLLDEGTLGALRRVTAAFTFCFDAVPTDNIRVMKEMGGGCLGDLGYYCVRAILLAFGELPQRVFATAREQFGVEYNLSALLWFSRDRMASFDCGFDTVMRQWFEIAGTKNSLVLDDFVLPVSNQRTRFWVHDPSGKSTEHGTGPCVQEVRMIERFSAAVRSGAPDPSLVEPALRVLKLTDALRASLRSGQVCSV